MPYLQVFLHYSLTHPAQQQPSWSTRREEGGGGLPEPFIIGKGGRRMLRGVELALTGEGGWRWGGVGGQGSWVAHMTRRVLQSE